MKLTITIIFTLTTLVYSHQVMNEKKFNSGSKITLGLKNYTNSF